MATETNAANDPDNASPADDPDSSIQTLRDLSPGFEAEIIVSADAPVRKTHYVEEGTGRLLEGEFGRPEYAYLSNYTYRCTCCDREFETEEAATAHLKAQYQLWLSQYRLPGTEKHPNEPGYPLHFGPEEQLTIGEFEIVGRKNRTNTCVLVTEGTKLCRATSRRSFSLPANYKFETWPALHQDGDLTFPDGEPRIRERQLAAAIRYLSSAALFDTYDPTNFTLYDRGDAPFLLQRHGEAILIAPVTQN
jgi:hypothetical protein